MSKIKTNTLETVDGTVSVDVKDLIGGGLGVGQIYKDAKNVDVDGQGKRVRDTEYTNNTKNPILVMIQMTSTGSANSSVTCVATVGGVTFQCSPSIQNSFSGFSQFIVPPNTIYKVTGSSTLFAINNWTELR